MKCLIINGSPKKNGNTDRVLDAFRTNFDGDIEEINPFSIMVKVFKVALIVEDVLDKKVVLLTMILTS